MKANLIRFLLFFLFTFTLSLNVDAQGVWITNYKEGDELLNIKGHYSYKYKNLEGYSFVYTSNNSHNFQIFTILGVHYDYNTNVQKSKITDVLHGVKIGYYNSNGKLLDSDKTSLIVDQNNPHLAQYPNPTIGAKVIRYLKQRKGYIRFVIPIAFEDRPLNFIVPCRTK